MYLCPLCKLKIVQDVIMRFLTNIKNHENMQNTKTVTLVNLLLELWPFEIIDIASSRFYNVLVSAL